ncbi:MAG: transporter substrate-binding domain-containing protein [Clostridiales bacterium]|nr:transporter substrate-binding domain-containing protein [Clostridiales bacterium]
MKKVLAFALTLLLTLGAVMGLTACNNTSNEDGLTGDLKAVKDAGKIIVGITDYAPMDYKDSNGKWIGFDAELAEKFAQELGVTCEFVEIVDWNNKVAEINSRQIDLIWNGMTADEELGKQIDFSVSYAKNAQVAVVLKNSTITTKDQIKTATVAVENGSAGQKVTVAEGFTNVSAPGNQKQALIEVKSGNSQVAIIDLTMAQSLVGKGEFDTLKIVEGVSYGDEIFAVGLRKGSNLKEKLDDFLYAQFENGTITALANTYTVGINTEALTK